MKRLFLTSAIVAFTALPVAAQTSADTQSGSAMGGQISADVTLRASEVIGHRLYMPQEGGMSGDQADSTRTMQDQGVPEAQDDWRMIGEIDDVILGTEGEVRAVVVDAGGFLGMNESTRRVEMENLGFLPDSDDEGEYFVVFTGDRAMFEQSENVDEATLGDRGESLGSRTWGDMRTDPIEDVDFADISTEELLGAAAYGSNDEWLGEVSELSLTEDGMVDHVIVDVGGFLGIGEKPVALPIDQVRLRRIDGDELRAYLPHTEDELDAMETWESETDL